MEGCIFTGVKYLLSEGGVQIYRCEIINDRGELQIYRCEILTDRWMSADLQV